MPKKTYTLLGNRADRENGNIEETLLTGRIFLA